MRINTKLFAAVLVPAAVLGIGLSACGGGSGSAAPHATASGKHVNPEHVEVTGIPAGSTVSFYGNDGHGKSVQSPIYQAGNGGTTVTSDPDTYLGTADIAVQRPGDGQGSLFGFDIQVPGSSSPGKTFVVAMPKRPASPATAPQTLQESCKVSFSTANGWLATITVTNNTSATVNVPSLGAIFVNAQGKPLSPTPLITGAIIGPGITMATTIAPGQTATGSGAPANLSDNPLPSNPAISEDANPALAPYFAGCVITTNTG
jgi:hypothetical protein